MDGAIRSSGLETIKFNRTDKQKTKKAMANIELKTKILNDKYTEYVYEAFDI